jgi:beta-glucosidase
MMAGIVARGIHVLLAPALTSTASRSVEGILNMSRRPIFGSAPVVPFVRGVQSQDVATAKHFAANNQEINRQSINVVVSERALRRSTCLHSMRQFE